MHLLKKSVTTAEATILSVNGTLWMHQFSQIKSWCWVHNIPSTLTDKVPQSKIKSVNQLNRSAKAVLQMEQV